MLGGVSSPQASPPSPPQVARRLRLRPRQWAGFVLLFALPVLACFKVFGPREETVEDEANGLKLTVTFMTRSRFSVQEHLRVEVSRRAGGGPAEPLRVEIARDYLSRFTILSATPAPDGLDEESFVFHLPAVAPGGGAGVAIELQGEAYGSARGVVRAVAGEGAAAQVELNSFVFP